MASTVSSHRRRARRRSVLERCFHQCFWCGRDLSNKSVTEDHFVPRCLGGNNKLVNIVASCEPCNHEKRDNLPSDEDWVRLSNITNNSPINELKALTGLYLAIDTEQSA